MAWPSQDRQLARYVSREVYPYSSGARRRLDAAGLGRNGIRQVSDLARLPAMSLLEVGDGRELVLRPDAETLRVFGGVRFTAALAWARLRGRAGSFQARVLEPAYKPLEWVVADGVPLAYTTTDLIRLGELGRRWLWQAGVGSSDVVVDLLPSDARLASLQLSGGCRVTRTPRIQMPPTSDPAEVAWLMPTVLAGRERHLLKILRGVRSVDVSFPALRTVIVAGELMRPAGRKRLAELLPSSVATVRAWSPPGVRAVWAECRAGEQLHTWPDVEIVETGERGLMWTGLGWRGSALLRLLTAIDAEADGGSCAQCGQESLRLRLR